MLTPTITTGPVPPTSPEPGDEWYNPITGRRYVWTLGSDSIGVWLARAPATNPPLPTPGDLWHNPANGRTYVWTLDASSQGVWLARGARPTEAPQPEGHTPVQTNAPNITNPTPQLTMAEYPPSGPIAGDFWYDTIRGFLFVYYNDGSTIQWVVANPGQGREEGPPGQTGEIGPPGINWLGEWNAATPYQVRDGVEHLGSSYYAVSENTNQVPDLSPAIWSLLAAKGDQGPAGGSVTITEGTGIDVTGGPDYTISVDQTYQDGRYVNVAGDTMTGPLVGTTATMSGVVTTPQVTGPAASLLVLNAVTGYRVSQRINGASIVETQSNSMFPGTTNAVALGGASNRWSGVYSVLGDFTGALTGTTGTFSGSVSMGSPLNVNSAAGVGTIEVGGATGALLDLKAPFSDDFDLRFYTDGAAAFISGAALTINNATTFAAIPTHPTPTAGDNTTKSATTAFVKAAVDASAAVDAGLYEIKTNKGLASGYAPLDATTKVPAIYLPAYVDDVLEFANLAAFPVTGTTGVIYVALDTNKTYRWGGSSYTEISPSPGSTDAVPEGAVNKYYTDERVDDRAAALIVGGTNITTAYNDTAGTLTINAAAYPTGLPPTGTAGGDLSGTYPNPLIKPSVTNGQVLTTVAGVAAWAGGGASVTIGDAPPGSPTAGNLWWESDSGKLLIYFNDGNTSQWVEANSSAGPPGPPGVWVQMTQAAYDALTPKVSTTLYVIVG